MSVVDSSGQFDVESLDHVRGTLLESLEGHSSGIWLTADEGEPSRVAYCAPEPVANGTWNLLMLGTRKDRMGQGTVGRWSRKLKTNLFVGACDC